MSIQPQPNRYIQLAKFQKIENFRLDTILKGNIYMSSILKGFNDPYEFSMDFSFADTADAGELVSAFINRIKIPESNGNRFSEVISRYIRSKARISCFCFIGEIETKGKGYSKPSEGYEISKVFLDHKHWSQYGDNHKGMCILYNIPTNNEIITKLHKVKYVDTIPKLEKEDFFFDEGKINIEKTIENIGDKMMSNKSKCWISEGECRFYHSENSQDLNMTGFKNCIQAIIFGLECDVESETIKLFIKELKSKDESIQFIKLVKNSKSFEPELREL